MSSDISDKLLCDNCGYEVDEVSSNYLCDTCFTSYDAGMLDTSHRVVQILESTIKKFMATNTTTIPVGVLNDILDLWTSTKLYALPEENQ
jgi:hypothetical protein